MNEQLQDDFASLGIPSLESDAGAFTEVTNHPALSRRSSSAKSIDSMELSNEGGVNPFTTEDVMMEEVCKVCDACELQAGASQANEKGLHMIVDGGCAQPVEIGSCLLPPPRRFYRRFWLGISRRLMRATNGGLNE